MLKKFSIYIVLSLAFLLITGCAHRTEKRYNPAEVDFHANYIPALEGQLYPILLLGLDNNMLNDSIPIVQVSLTSPDDDAVVRIVIDSSRLNYVTYFQETMPKKGSRYTFNPSIKWKYDVLKSLRHQGKIDFTITCFINDEEVDVKNIRLTYRSVNECLLSARGRDGKTYETRWLFAAYVNEEHPIIDSILTQLINEGIISSFLGYQSTAKKVDEQVFAIWYYALNHGIAYSSISCTPNPSLTANVQHIRFFDEVYNTRQANCVDACVFFASILRRIGLKPVIFVEPCHAYLGYYTDKNRKTMALLETTITSWVNFPEMGRTLKPDGRLSDKWYSKAMHYLSDDDRKKYDAGKMSFEELKLAIARTLFNKAKAYNVDNYKANKALFPDPSKITYQQLDIENLRRYIQPVSLN